MSSAIHFTPGEQRQTQARRMTMLNVVEGPTSVYLSEEHRLASKLEQLRSAAYNIARDYLSERAQSPAGMTPEAEVGATLYLLRRVTSDIERALHEPLGTQRFDDVDDGQPF